MSKLLGTVVRYPVTAGQPMTRGAIVGPKDRGFLAAALGPGMRAVTVPVNATTGVAGFIFPGDRVDIVLTQEVAGGGEGPALKVSETIVRNVRVLATDQRTDSKGEDGKTEVKTFSNVTLEATPRIAEKIAVAQSIGSLSLSLRSIADNTSELERAVASGEVKVPEGTNPAQERQMLLAVANRPIDTNTTFSPVATCRASSAAPSRLARTPAARWPMPWVNLPTPLGVVVNPLVRRPVRSFVLPAAIVSPSFRWELANMTSRSKIRRARLGTAFAALAIGLGTVAAPAPALAQASRNYRPSQEVQLSVGEGQMVRLPRNVADVWTSNPGVADVHVTNASQLNLFGKEFGRPR